MQPDHRTVETGPWRGRVAETRALAFCLHERPVTSEAALHDWPGHANGVCLLRIASGRARLESCGRNIDVTIGDLIFGYIGRRLTIADSNDCTIQMALFPDYGSAARLTALTPAAPLVVLSPSRASTGILGEFLRAAVTRRDRLTADEMRSVELTLQEFLASAIAAEHEACRVLDGSATKNALARRAMQVIELHLANPDLSPTLVAELAGISLRYLQQLFEAMGENANRLIRRRRLERCCADLRDRRYADQSISAICFRWGFGDSAYFSRIFKEAYGVSPSVFRLGVPALAA